LSDEAQRIEQQSRPENTLKAIAMRLCSLRAAIKTCVLTDYVAVIAEAWSIDGDLANWSRLLPIEYAYTILPCLERASGTITGEYHVYTDTRIANIWNTYRCLRILANEVILDQFMKNGRADFDCNQEFLSKYLMDLLFTEVCCSVPPFLRTDESPTCPRALGSFFLWPLYLVAATNYASNMTREWVINQLEKIGDIMGILQATAVANVLRSNGDITSWQRGTTIIGDEDHW
jgi:hypothetical protein